MEKAIATEYHVLDLAERDPMTTRKSAANRSRGELLVTTPMSPPTDEDDWLEELALRAALHGGELRGGCVEGLGFRAMCFWQRGSRLGGLPQGGGAVPGGKVMGYTAAG